MRVARAHVKQWWYLFTIQASSPTQLGRYEILSELASGGMGTVYLARLSGAGGFRRTVAIKRLHPHLAKERSFIEMFLDEARLASRIHHPNVVPIVEIGENQSGFYVVMEYVEGASAACVFNAARAKTVPVPVTIRIVLDTLLGLHAAHELPADDGSPLGLVHRDVSPHNILVGTDGASRITDFGVARAASRLTNTQTGHVKGKLAYMAPEQAAGAPLDRRADLFAMGIVLWEGLTGKRLFKRETDVETLTRLLYEPIVAPSTINPDVPPEVDAVVLKALERDPSKRYPTGADFAESLEAAARVKNFVAPSRAVGAEVEIAAADMISSHRDLVTNRGTSQVSFSGQLPMFEGTTTVTPTNTREMGDVTSASNVIHVGSQRRTHAPTTRGNAWRKVAMLAVPLLGVTLAATALGVSRRADRHVDASTAVAPQVVRAAPPPLRPIETPPVSLAAPTATASPGKPAQPNVVRPPQPHARVDSRRPTTAVVALTAHPAPAPVPTTAAPALPKVGDDFANPYR